MLRTDFQRAAAVRHALKAYAAATKTTGLPLQALLTALLEDVRQLDGAIINLDRALPPARTESINK